MNPPKVYFLPPFPPHAYVNSQLVQKNKFFFHMKPCKASYIASYILAENNTSEKKQSFDQVEFFPQNLLVQTWAFHLQLQKRSGFITLVWALSQKMAVRSIKEFVSGNWYSIRIAGLTKSILWQLHFPVGKLCWVITKWQIRKIPSPSPLSFEHF